MIPNAYLVSSPVRNTHTILAAAQLHRVQGAVLRGVKGPCHSSETFSRQTQPHSTVNFHPTSSTTLRVVLHGRMNEEKTDCKHSYSLFSLRICRPTNRTDKDFCRPTMSARQFHSKHVVAYSPLIKTCRHVGRQSSAVFFSVGRHNICRVYLSTDAEEHRPTCLQVQL